MTVVVDTIAKSVAEIAHLAAVLQEAGYERLANELRKRAVRREKANKWSVPRLPDERWVSGKIL